MHKMNSKNKTFIDKLRSSGLRPTNQRVEISKFLFNRKKTFHFTVEELKNYNISCELIDIQTLIPFDVNH